MIIEEPKPRTSYEYGRMDKKLKVAERTRSKLKMFTNVYSAGDSVKK